MKYIMISVMACAIALFAGPTASADPAVNVVAICMTINDDPTIQGVTSAAFAQFEAGADPHQVAVNLWKAGTTLCPNRFQLIKQWSDMAAHDELPFQSGLN